jgi:hypothetical protein
MRSNRASTRIRATKSSDNLEVVVVGADGKDATLRLTADAAASLATILSEFASKRSLGSDATLTKRPKSFAVGTGRFERVVLLRFEDDPPYALRPELAQELCEALVEVSADVSDQPDRVLQ